MSRSEREIADLRAKAKALEDDNLRLRSLLADQMRTGENLEYEAIVNADGVPKINIRWDQMGTQVSPAEARNHAWSLMRVAEWAESDALVFTTVQQKMGVEAAAALMMMLRRGRVEEDAPDA